MTHMQLWATWLQSAEIYNSFATLGFLVWVLMSLTKKKQLCLVHRWCIFLRVKMHLLLGTRHSFSWGYCSSKIFPCLQMTCWIRQRERCSISIDLTDNTPPLLVKPYFITRDLWLILSHQHSKTVAANRSAKERWAYIWMFFFLCV